MQDLKESLLEQHIILITTKEECDAVNALLRLGFKVLYYGGRGWMLFQFARCDINLEDIVTIMKIEHISIKNWAVIINKNCVPVYWVNSLKLYMLWWMKN